MEKIGKKSKDISRKDHRVKEQDEYAILTNIIHQEWSDLSVKGHKQLKGLKTENLRDHMTEAELIFTALAELSTRQIAENMQTTGLEKNKIPAKKDKLTDLNKIVITSKSITKNIKNVINNTEKKVIKLVNKIMLV